MFFQRKKTEMPQAVQALPAFPGRQEPILMAGSRFLNRWSLIGPYPEGLETAVFGLGCFWGVGIQA